MRNLLTLALAVLPCLTAALALEPTTALVVTTDTSRSIQDAAIDAKKKPKKGKKPNPEDEEEDDDEEEDAPRKPKGSDEASCQVTCKDQWKFVLTSYVLQFDGC